ncbi:hypothetical protein, partial [Stenotrophomonas pavanii]|uniref:hypothetical protein n=1 Tax=Stenotrophomonas pavanii TaxID=487698 RepID=UPI0039C6F7D7
TAAISAGNGKRRRKPAFFFIGSAGRWPAIADPDVAGQRPALPAFSAPAARVRPGLAVHERHCGHFCWKRKTPAQAGVLLHR